MLTAVILHQPAQFKSFGLCMIAGIQLILSFLNYDFTYELNGSIAKKKYIRRLLI